MRYKHYLNLAPYGWNAASRQAGTKDLDQVRDNNPPSQDYPIHSWTSVWGKRINCPFHSPVNDHPCSYPQVQTFCAAAGAATSSVTTMLGNWPTNSQVSPSDCIRLPKGATKDPSLIVDSLETALYNIADMGKLLMELQKVLHLLRSSLPPFYIPAELVYRIPSFVGLYLLSMY